MLAFIGLGNPGEKYEKNRHNVGFLFVDAIAKKHGLELVPNKYVESWVTTRDQYLLAKPTTFMNASGDAVKKLISFYSLLVPNIHIVHDDLDIRLGEYKIQKGVGPKLHNGINSIEEKLGTDQFYRIRIGVDNRTLENRIPGDIYSLQDFTAAELKIIHEVHKKIIKQLHL